MSFQERLAIIVEANAGKAIAEFKKVGAAAKQAGVSAEGGAKGMARFGIAGQTATNLLKGGIAVAAAGAAAAITKFAVDGVTAFVDVTAEIRKFQRVSGATAEDASKLVAAFHVLGIDADAAGVAVFRMAVNIGAGKKAFAESGVEIARTKTGAVDLVGTILNVGDAYKKLPDATKRADLLANVFGARAGQTLGPLLGKTREQIEEIFKAAGRHGLIFSQEQLDKAREFTAATRELSESFKGLQIEAGEKLVPFLTDLAIAMTKVIDASHGNLGKGAEGLLSMIGPGGWMSGPIIKGAMAGLHLFADGEGEAGRALAETTTQIQEQTTEIEDLKKSIFTATDAQRSYEAAGRSVEEAHRTYNKALGDYNKLLKEGAVDEEKVADARRSLADATRSLGHAQREQATAQDEYNDAAAAADILGTDTALDKKKTAADNLADANDSVASALEAQVAAAADLAKAKAGDPDYQQKLADAKQHVKDATQGIADAEYNLGKQSYLNVAAHDAETAAIGAKAAQVLGLKTQIEELLKLHPEQSPYLLPLLNAMGGAINAGVPGISLGGGGLLPGLSGPGALVPPVFGPPAPTAGTGGDSIASKVGGVVVNITEAVADPVNIARKIIWNLVG